MTNLQRAALANVPLTESTVESFWDGSHSGTSEQCLRALCVSHERLRAELQRAEVLLAEADAQIAKARALTDTGSPEFRAAFPPKSAGEALYPRDTVPGWRVVEKIRETLT